MPQFDLSLSALRDYRPEVTEPADFDDFWRQTIDEARKHDLSASERQIDNKFALVDTYDVTFAGFGGTEVKAWLHVPSGATGPLPTVVQFQGYSVGRGLPQLDTRWAQAGWAHFIMDTRGQGWSVGGFDSTADGSVDAGIAHVPGVMTAGITDPQRYYYRRVYTDAVRMLEAAAASRFVDPTAIVVTGASQGGGLTLAAAGLASLVGINLVGAAADVPFLCHFRRAIELTDKAPYVEITEYLAAWRDHEEAAYRTLGYFDGVNLARRASAPALFSVGLMDEICPPSTVFAAFNFYGEAAGAASKDINVYPHNGHEGGAGYQLQALLDWFAQRFTDSP